MFYVLSITLDLKYYMILGMIDLTTHDEKTLRVVEGQVLDDSKNTIITKEEDGFVNLFQFVRILFMTLL